MSLKYLNDLLISVIFSVILKEYQIRIFYYKPSLIFVKLLTEMGIYNLKEYFAELIRYMKQEINITMIQIL